MRPALLLVVALVACSVFSGCNSMFRRMTIRSEPSGALVLIDGREVGHTPYTADFTYYADHEVTLIKDGFETKTVLLSLQTPWYQVPPLDFVSDNFLPYTVTNRQAFCVTLEPQVIVPAQELLDRAKSLRSEAQISQ
jgi:hypothetical protein